MRRVLSDSELWDMTYGSAVFGTGGGGSPEVGYRYLKRVVDAGHRVVLVDLEAVGDDDVIVCPAGVGSIAPGEWLQDLWKLLDERIATERNPYFEALRFLQQHLGRPICGCVPVEMGGFSTACAAWTAALAGGYLVDADPVGRAVPEVELQTFTLHGVPVAPAVISDLFGNVLIAAELAGDKAAEEIARAVAVMSGTASFVGRPVEGRVLKRTVIGGTVSRAMVVGRALREWRDRGVDAVSAIAQASGARVVFKGTVSRVEWEDKGGFMWGNHYIAGTGEYSGHVLRVWFKNENLVSWHDGEPFITCPDLICIVDLYTGFPITNTLMEAGREVAVLGIPGRAVWRSEMGLKLLSPAHFGFDIPYRPMEAIGGFEV